jgi:hypothetical protein
MDAETQHPTCAYTVFGLTYATSVSVGRPIASSWGTLSNCLSSHGWSWTQMLVIPSHLNWPNNQITVKLLLTL